jgi:methyl-accepting chemotaxis protein
LQKKSPTYIKNLVSYLVKTLILVIPVTFIISLIAGNAIGIPSDMWMIYIISQILMGIFLVLVASTKNFILYIRPSLRIIDMLKETVIDHDLRNRIVSKTRSEVGELGKYFNELIETIQTIMKNISSTTTVLNKSSESLLNVSDKLSVNSNQVTKKSDAVTAIITDMTSVVEDTATELTAVSNRMSVVTSSVGEMARSTNNLASASTQTSHLVGQVTGIVEQISSSIYSASSSAQEVSHSVGNVATAVKEISYSLTEISRNCERSIHIRVMQGKTQKIPMKLSKNLTIRQNKLGKLSVSSMI